MALNRVILYGRLTKDVDLRQTNSGISVARFTTTITLSKSDRKIAYHTEFVNESKNIRLRAAFPINALSKGRHQIPYALVEREAGEQVAQMFIDAGYDMNAFESMYGKEKIRDAQVYGKDLKDRYSVLWLHYALFGEEA